jgi:hypothetical protein
MTRFHITVLSVYTARSLLTVLSEQMTRSGGTVLSTLTGSFCLHGSLCLHGSFNVYGFLISCDSFASRGSLADIDSLFSRGSLESCGSFFQYGSLSSNDSFTAHGSLDQSRLVYVLQFSSQRRLTPPTLLPLLYIHNPLERNWEPPSPLIGGEEGRAVPYTGAMNTMFAPVVLR